MLTQLFGIDGVRHVSALQALTPYSVWLLAPVAVWSLRDRNDAAATTASVVGLAVLVLAVPIVFPATPAPANDAPSLRVGVVNLLHTNTRTDEIADDLEARELDLIVFTELTPAHLTTLDGHPLAERFPHRSQKPGPLADGVAVWSTVPLDDATPPPTVSTSIETTVEVAGFAFRLIAVHPPTPIYDFDGWRNDLDTLGDIVSRHGGAGSMPPTLVAGDFNASYWHPRFRRLLDHGLTSAHIALGRGWSASWPTDIALAPYVRLDHALTGGGLVPTAVEDFRVAGSDHAGFVVTVAPAHRTGP